MKSNKPIKRHPAIAELSRDHHTGLLLVWKIREGIKKSIEAERIKRYVIYCFDTELEPHFKEEEELLFNKIAKENELRMKAETDHATLRQLAEDMKKGPLSSYMLIGKFGDSLEKHIRFEERELFNFIQDSFPEIVLLQISSSLNDKSKKQNFLPWTDTFWERKI